MSEPHKSAGAIFDAAIELPPERRAAYLLEACAGDEALRQRVEALICAHELAGTFMDGPAAHPNPKTVVIRPAEQPGDRIGRYKLLQQIGEGGCGVVYMAEQEEPVRRRVALKVIKLGMDTKQVIARFEAERQALALMDHPNIAKVLDAGATDSGRPYFVMELVRGVKITDYCDENNLSTAARLELFIQVCQAIQHAHQKGIIHRDIKPSNILVADHDGVPVPKVIDFGIAKATTDQRLTDKTLFTAFEQFIGTPAYMSPEQARLSGLDIDTRSDIYSLGVLLYELLTAKTPFESKRLFEMGLDEIRRIIREEEPLRPSTRLQALEAEEQTTVARHRQSEPPKLFGIINGDLDWIVMKCLEKERARRYETANGLAADIQRHLSNEPVNARPPSSFYRLQKSVRRNKGVFAAAGLITTVLVIGVVVSTLEAIRAKRAEREQSRLRLVAETKEKKSEQVAQFLQDMLRGVGPSVALGRDTTMLGEIVDKTAARIGTDLTNQPEVEIELRLTLGQVYYDLQLYKKAEETSRETLRLAKAHLGEENLPVADALSLLGRSLVALRELKEAGIVIHQEIALQRKLRGEGSLEEVRSLTALGNLSIQQGKLSEAESAFRAGVEICRKNNGRYGSYIAVPLLGLNVVLENEGRLAEAEDAAREALAIDRKLLGEKHPYLGSAYERLGRTLLSGSADRLPEAEIYLRKALEIEEKTDGKEKLSHQQFSHFSLAEALERQGKLPDAEIHFREALEIDTKSFGTNYPDRSRYIAGLARILDKQGKSAEVETLYRDLLAAQRVTMSNDSPVVAETLVNLAGALLAQGKQAAAEQAYRQALAMEEKLPGDEHAFAANSSVLADILRRSGRTNEAGVMARDAAQKCHASMAHYEQLASDSNRQHESWSFAISDEALAGLLEETGQTPEAEKAYRDAQVLWRKLAANFKTEDYRFHLAVNDDALGNLLRASGRAAESLELKRDAQAIWLKSVAESNLEDRRAHLGWTDEDIGQLLTAAGRFDEAAEAYRQAVAVWKKLSADFDKQDYRDHLSRMQAKLTELHPTAAGK